AQTPGYNANNTSSVARYSPGMLRNRALTDTYEPGSTFKLVTVTGALSDHLVSPNTRFTLPYLYKYGSCWQCQVHDAEERGTVKYSVSHILEFSSNVSGATPPPERT